MRNFSNSMRFVLPVVAALVATGSVTACSMTDGRETGGEYADNSAITAKVKTALANEGGMSLFNNVSVETMNEVVQLSGFVPTANDRIRAGQIASSVEGVRSVRNDLVIQP